MIELEGPDDLEAPIDLELLVDGPPDVSFVVPASAYDSIATDDELSPPVAIFAQTAVRFAEPDLGPTLRAVEELGRSIGEKLDGLATRFDREIRAESTREKVVDRLHSELQEYKQDLLLNAMRPVFVDLIQLHDDVGKMAITMRDSDPSGGDPSRFAGLLAGIQQGIEDILYRQGIEPFSHDSETFDARRQRAVATVSTDDPALARRVAERHRKGFVAGEKVIRPEVVSVFVVKVVAPATAIT
jgi:molecular chaperone GrpE